MEATLSLDEALVRAISEGGPMDAVGDRYLRRASELAGVPVSVLRKMEQDGKLDAFMSERFYYLSLVALGGVLEAIGAGEVDGNDMGRIAIESAKLGQKLAGRDIQKKYIVNADAWEHAALQAQERPDGIEQTDEVIDGIVGE